MKTGCCQVTSVVCSAFLLGAPVCAQSAFPKTDPRIKTQLTVTNPRGKPGQPIVIDVHVENLDQADIRKNQFSPISSSVGLPTFRIVTVSGGEEVAIPPGLFVENPGDWDRWYQPASGPGASQVGAFVLPARTRVHLLHGDLRLMIEQAGAYCQRELATGTLLEQPEARATKQYYQDLVRFARRFSAGGAYDLTVWAYAQSNTVRIQIER
jgi:hypothetical protein